MKKFASLLLTAVLLCTMVCAFAVNVSADEDTTVVEPSENGEIRIDTDGNYIIKGEAYTVGYLAVNSSDCVLTIPKGAVVTVEESFTNVGTLYVDGTLIVKVSLAANDGKIHVGCGGKLKGAICGTGIFEYADHVFADGKCTECGMSESEVREDEPTEIVPDIELIMCNKDDVIINEDCEIDQLLIGNAQHKGMSLTVARGVTVTVIHDCANWGMLHVYGTLNLRSTAENQDTIHVGCGGKIEGAINGRGKVVKDSHDFDKNWVCKNCGAADPEKHRHSYVDGICACGLEHSPHDYQPTAVYRCECGKAAPEDFVPVGGEGSTLSEGSLTIICTIAALVLGLGGGFLLGRKKKKPALASGENTDEE